MESAQSQELVRGIRQGLLQWYDMKPGSTVLYIGGWEDALAEMLAQKPVTLLCVSAEQSCESGWREKNRERFDYLIAIEVLECSKKPEEVLHTWHTLLKENGRLLLGMNNRLGIRYFCGDRDPYTERNFDGVEAYRRAYAKKEDVFQGKCYSRCELEQMLTNTGWPFARFYSVLPDLHNASLIYGEDYLPKEDLANRMFPTYNHPDTVFLEEAPIYKDLIENGMFHTMANAWLIDCGSKEGVSDILHVTCSMERGREHALYTILRNSGRVEKRAAYPEGEKRLTELADHARELKDRGIAVVDTKMENGICVMPLVEAKVGQVYLKELLQSDVDQFLQKMDKFRDLILESSEIVEADKGDGEGVILRKGYLDMVPLNSFYMNDTFVFYDQEFCEENYPANAVITRMIATFYAGNAEFDKILPINTLFERYELTKYLDRWRKMEWEFLDNLKKEKELKKYHEGCRADGSIINANRQRMNYSEKLYQRLFVDIFRNADTRKLILFGSGNFTANFMALYGQDYPVYAIVDNNRRKWGQTVEGVLIQSPDLLKNLQNGEYKVLICIKNYVSVMKQLENMGVRDYGIYDSGKAYPRKRKPIVQTQRKDEKQSAPKKYHIGYIAGVFDLFHVGHLNMFKRAKEQCEYLIVGVVSDEGVQKYKKVEPFIPYEERAEIVRSCRYVDEVVEIPLNYGGTRDAYRLHHFDCQFSGSDYIDNPEWLAEKDFLEKHGAEMVFFPYTESTSSSRLKRLIEKRLV